MLCKSSIYGHWYLWGLLESLSSGYQGKTDNISFPTSSSTLSFSWTHTSITPDQTPSSTCNFSCLIIPKRDFLSSFCEFTQHFSSCLIITGQCPWEVDSAMEIHMKEFYWGVFLGSTSLGTWRKQHWAAILSLQGHSQFHGELWNHEDFSEFVWIITRGPEPLDPSIYQSLALRTWDKDQVK